jgi:hypothetical protein
VDFAQQRQLRFVKTSTPVVEFCSLVQQSHWTGFDVQTFATVHRAPGDIALSRTNIANQACMRDVVANGVFEMDEESFEFNGDFYVDARCSLLECNSNPKLLTF